MLGYVLSLKILYYLFATTIMTADGHFYGNALCATPKGASLGASASLLLHEK
jgi:hypothetical protein